ncbi:MULTISPECIES: sporulation histidine kinase inhibitor Sda [Paenibacillus]|uniref:sporulation histidine kinase inhibitor Sda n=1 Tax=Paenibacillus TaxID=44249 RepID=UPI0009D6FA9E|nr:MULTISPECIES: sporulation histidine kinase inhibitor Sda [Paenibacillus]
MNYYFHPSPRPSSLESISDEELLNIYALAVEAQALPDFIEIVKEILDSRDLIHSKEI